MVVPRGVGGRRGDWQGPSGLLGGAVRVLRASGARDCVAAPPPADKGRPQRARPTLPAVGLGAQQHCSGLAGAEWARAPAPEPDSATRASASEGRWCGVCTRSGGEEEERRGALAAARKRLPSRAPTTTEQQEASGECGCWVGNARAPAASASALPLYMSVHLPISPAAPGSGSRTSITDTLTKSTCQVRKCRNYSIARLAARDRASALRRRQPLLMYMLLSCSWFRSAWRLGHNRYGIT